MNDPVVPTGRKSAGLAWAISIGEAILLAAAAVVLIKFWLMIPFLIRSSAAGVLSLLALLGIYRVVRFHRSTRPRPVPLPEHLARATAVPTKPHPRASRPGYRFDTELTTSRAVAAPKSH